MVLEEVSRSVQKKIGCSPTHDSPKYDAFFRQEMAATCLCCPNKHIPACSETSLHSQLMVRLGVQIEYLYCSTAVVSWAFAQQQLYT